MEQVEINATKRTKTGKGDCRRLRLQGMVPGVVYGLKRDPVLLNIDPVSIKRIMKSKSGLNSLCSLRIEGEPEAQLSMVKHFQVDPILQVVIHADFLRISLESKLKVRVPIHINGMPVGVKDQGGVLEFVHRNVEVECLPDRIPDRIEVDVTALKIGDFIRFGQLAMVEGVTVLDDVEDIVVNVAAPRLEVKEPTAGEGEAAAAAEPAEPEVIGKKKKAADEEGAEEEGKKDVKKEGKKEGK